MLPMETKSEQNINTKVMPTQGKSETFKTIVELPTNSFPATTISSTKINQVAYVLIDKNNLKTAYQDLTGRFPIKSSRGN